MGAGEVMALYHFNEAEHLEGPAVIGELGESCEPVAVDVGALPAAACFHRGCVGWGQC